MENTKVVYQYDDTGLLSGSRTLDNTDKSPVSGAWQIPWGCTEVAPLEVKEGYNLYLKEGKWEYVEIPKEKPKELEVVTPTKVDPANTLTVDQVAL